MISSRSRSNDPTAGTTAQPPPASPLRKPDDAVDTPRWGLLAAAILVAWVTAAWVGSAFSTAQVAAPRSASAQPQGK